MTKNNKKNFIINKILISILLFAITQNLSWAQIQKESDKANPIESTLVQEDTRIFLYISRVTGIVSFILFTGVICMGLLMTSKFLLKFPFISAPRALEAHSFTASFIAFTFLLLHFISLFFDSFLRLKLSEVLIPFSFNRDMNSVMGNNISAPVNMGIIAFYLAIVLILTSQFRRKIVSVKLWRKIHYSSFLFYILFLFHGIFSGSDTREWWMISIYTISATLVFSLLILRIFGKKYFIPTRPVVPNPPIQTNIEPTIKPANIPQS